MVMVIVISVERCQDVVFMMIVIDFCGRVGVMVTGDGCGLIWFDNSEDGCLGCD